MIKLLTWEDLGYTYINSIFKDPDCQHCGDEWEYQCYECEQEEEMKDAEDVLQKGKALKTAQPYVCA